MPVDKFGRFYTGSLDKFGRYQSYGAEQANNEIVGIPLETARLSGDQYSDTSFALYGASNRYSNYRVYTNKTGIIMGIAIPNSCTLFVDEIPVTLDHFMPIKKDAKLRLYKRIEDTTMKAIILIKVKGLDDQFETVFKDECVFGNCRVFRFLQDSGVVIQEHLPDPTAIFLNGVHIGPSIVGRRLAYKDVLSFYPPNGDSECEIFFVIRSPIQNEHKA